MSQQSSISFCYLDGKGSSKPCHSKFISEKPDETLWIHLDRGSNETDNWLNDSNLDDFIKETLNADGVRPRSQVHENGILVILRGVNLNPESEPDDMVSIRAWIEEKRIITVRQRKIMALTKIQNKLDTGKGPVNSGDFLVQLIEGLNERMVDVVDTLDDSVDELEEHVLEHPQRETRNRLSEIRRQLIRLRRHMAPQKEVLIRLQNEKLSWFNQENRLDLREAAESMTRYVEDLDSAKERASVTQDALESRMNAQMNRTMYLLSIITVVFLPLGFITGLLGINVSGIPHNENPNAFGIVCAGLTLLLCLQVSILFFLHSQNKKKY